jgi:hypothetical protein
MMLVQSLMIVADTIEQRANLSCVPAEFAGNHNASFVVRLIERRSLRNGS